MKRYFKREQRRLSSGLAAFPLSSGFVPFTQAEAEGLAAVHGCVQAISTAIASLPVFLYRVDRNGARTEVQKGRFRRLLSGMVNTAQTWPEFIEQLIAEMLLRGNGLAEIVSGRNGEIEALRVIPWTWVTVSVVDGRKLVYDVFEQYGLEGAQGARRRLLSSEVVHIKDRTDNGLVGVSRLSRARRVLDAALTVDDFAEASFSNYAKPSGMLTFERTLTETQRKQIRESWDAVFSGADRAGKVAVLGADMKFTDFAGHSPQDRELLSSRKWATEEICRIFQVPPPLVQDYEHNTFTNSEQAGRWFAQFGLLPIVRKLEAGFNAALWPSGEYQIDIDMSGFDRSDPQTRWANHERAVHNGILTVDEVREIEGYGPMKSAGGF